MLDFRYEKANTLVITLLLIAFILSCPSATSAMSSDKEKTASDSSASDRGSNETSQEAGQASISYVLFANAMKVDPNPESRPRYVTPEKYAESLNLTKDKAGPQPFRQVRTRIASAPLSGGEKFKIFVQGAFYPPGPYVQSLFTSSINEALDNDEGKEDTFGNYLADTMTRTARSLAFGTTSKFLEKFALPVVFKQDPRYHRSGKRSTGARIGYAISRVFITRGDNGNDQFNASFLLGGAMTAAISNVWERDENQTVNRSLSRWGIHIGFSALSNVAREFLGGQ